MLLCIRDQLNLSSSKDMCFWAACLIAFYGFLRKSTLLLKASNCTPSSGLCRYDIVTMTKKSFVLQVRNSKTIQFGQKVLSLPFYRCKVKQLCPVCALSHHLSSSPLPKDCALFSYNEGGCVKILTHSIFSHRLKSLLGKAGFDKKLISAHSFRRGGTSFAIKCGLSPIIVKARGDWSSNAYENYIFLVDNSTLWAARQLSKAAAKSV